MLRLAGAGRLPRTATGGSKQQIQQLSCVPAALWPSSTGHRTCKPLLRSRALLLRLLGRRLCRRQLLGRLFAALLGGGQLDAQVRFAARGSSWGTAAALYKSL